MTASMVIQDINMLHIKSVDVTAEEASVLIKVLENELKKHPTGIGLSAIQIGIPKRVAIVRSTRNVDLINATITEAKNPFISVGEGCLSCPGKRINVERFSDITVNNMVIRDGKLEESIFSMSINDDDQNNDGISAIAVQHEIDHTNGILITDKQIEIPDQKIEASAGRNDPCPCGSGKKYKKCCLSKKG